MIAKFVVVRTKLLGVPSRLRQRCPHLSRDDTNAVDDLIREALEELATDDETDDESEAL